MNELNLVGLHEDGESLVLVCSGQRYTLRIDDALRAAVRRDRPQLERVQDAGSMSVREIQARIRAGASAEEVAQVSGIALERVRRYEGPVLAEREHVVSRARASVVGPDGSPPLDELVADRLAARGVAPEGVDWDSSRDASGEWRVVARFTAGGSRRTATWRYDAGARAVAALDDEARWLSETEVGRADVLPRVGAAGAESEVVRAVLSPVDEREASPDAATTDALLDDLGRRRGQRGDADPAEEGARERSPWGPRQDAARHPSRSRPAMSVDLPHLDRVRLVGADDADENDGPDHDAADDGGRAGHGYAGHGHDDGHDDGRADVVALPLPAGGPTGAIEDDEAGGAVGAVGAGGAVGAADTGGPGRAAAASHEHVLHDRQARRTTGRKGRTKIPSWDEIMFGSRPDQ